MSQLLAFSEIMLFSNSLLPKLRSFGDCTHYQRVSTHVPLITSSSHSTMSCHFQKATTVTENVNLTCNIATSSGAYAQLFKQMPPEAPHFCLKVVCMKPVLSRSSSNSMRKRPYTSWPRSVGLHFQSRVSTHTSCVTQPLASQSIAWTHFSATISAFRIKGVALHYTLNPCSQYYTYSKLASYMKSQFHHY